MTSLAKATKEILKKAIEEMYTGEEQPKPEYLLDYLEELEESYLRDFRHDSPIDEYTYLLAIRIEIARLKTILS